MSKITVRGVAELEEFLQADVDIDLRTLELYKISGIHLQPGESADILIKNPGHIVLTITGKVA